MNLIDTASKNPVATFCTGVASMGLTGMLLEHELFSGGFVLTLALILGIIGLGVYYTNKIDSNYCHYGGQRTGGGFLIGSGVLALCILCILELAKVIQ